MKLSTPIALLLASSLCLLSFGRVTYPWSFEELFDRSDLVVIATPVSSENTTEKELFENTVGATGDRPGLKTYVRFKVNHAHKGESESEEIVYYYLKYDFSESIGAINPPSIPSFVISKNKRYLLFLKKNKDGYYESTSRTADAAFSVFRIEGNPIVK